MIMAGQRFTSVWDAIEDTPQQAASIRARADLMRALQAWIESARAAEHVSNRHSGESRNPENSRHWTPAFAPKEIPLGCAGVTAYSAFP